MTYVMTRSLYYELRAKCYDMDIVDYVNQSFGLCVVIKKIRIKN